MKIKEIMSKDVQIVSPDTSLHDVAKKMQLSDCGSVLVAKDDRLLGVITDRDIALRCVAEAKNASDTKAEDIMTHEILYCRDSDEMEDVALNMTKNKVRRMPVLDQHKRLVGSRQLYDAGSIDFQNLLDVQRTLLSAEDSYAQSRLARLSASVDLYLALGGGWISKAS